MGRFSRVENLPKPGTPAPKPKCEVCEDYGFIVVNPKPTCGADFHERTVPCLCAAGDERRALWEHGKCWMCHRPADGFGVSKCKPGEQPGGLCGGHTLEYRTFLGGHRTDRELWSREAIEKWIQQRKVVME